MISANNGTWTDSEETMDFHTKFVDIYGTNVAQPACQFCGRSTCYMVEEADIQKDATGKVVYARPKKTGVGTLVNIMHLAVIAYENRLFLPVSICENCSARSEASILGRHLVPQYPDLRSRCMTESDRNQYMRIFRYRIADIQTQRDDAAAKQAGRYRA